MSDKITYAEPDAMPDLRDTLEFEQLTNDVEKIIPKRCVSYGYIKRNYERLNRTKADYYKIGLALSHLEKTGRITIDESNPHLTKFKKGGREITILQTEDWNSKFRIHKHKR